MKALIIAAILTAAPVQAQTVTNMVFTLDSTIINTKGKNIPACFINKAVVVPATCSVAAAALRVHVCGTPGPDVDSTVCRRQPFTVLDFIIDGVHTGAA